jgi:hypothetical protein
MLGPVARRVHDPDLHRTDLDDLRVFERLERIVRLGKRMDRDREAVLEREASVPRDVVRVRMRFEDALDPHALLLGDREILLDRERRIDDDGGACLCIADEVGRAPEILVHELPKEQHGC